MARSSTPQVGFLMPGDGSAHKAQRLLRFNRRLPRFLLRCREIQHPAADYDPSAPTEPYLLPWRQLKTTMAGSATLRRYRRLCRALPALVHRVHFHLPDLRDRPPIGSHRRSSTSFNPTLPRPPAHRSHHLRPGNLRAGLLRPQKPKCLPLRAIAANAGSETDRV